MPHNAFVLVADGRKSLSIGTETAETAETAEMLKKRALAHGFDTLIVIATTKTLGELRKHHQKKVEHRLVGELAKDLTGLTIPDIEKALQVA